MDSFPDDLRPDAEILQLLGLRLNNHDFVFDKKDYLQVQGDKYMPVICQHVHERVGAKSLAKCRLQPPLC